MSATLACFKPYDVRGRIPDELNEELAYRIGRAYAGFLAPAQVVVGQDIRLSSESLAEALIRGLVDAGVNVFRIGQCGTEEVYFATFHYELDGGIIVTASHNPKEFNGMKFVRERSIPISGNTGLREIERLTCANAFQSATTQGVVTELDHASAYERHLLGYIDPDKCRPLKIVVNAGNGGAGKVVDALEERLPFEFVKVHHQVNGYFPNGVPNPMLPQNRVVTSQTILDTGADLGVAWDGDFDRCFFFDEQGSFVEGYYVVGLLAEEFLDRRPGDKVVHDPRLIWNTVEIATRRKGVAVRSATGHAFMKETMRRADAIYGGEMSAHHYFRDFAYCDSGMIPWLLVAELMSVRKMPLSALVAERRERYPISGEINRRVDNPQDVIARIRGIYEEQSLGTDLTDGVSLEFNNWRFNLRVSNTEPLIRLNVESRADRDLTCEKTEELLALIGGEPG